MTGLDSIILRTEEIQKLLRSDSYLSPEQEESIIGSVFNPRTTAGLMNKTDFSVDLLKIKLGEDFEEIIDYAYEKSDGRRRKCGNLEVRHSGFAAVYAQRLGLSPESIKGCIIHDTPEDSCRNDFGKAEEEVKEIRDKFGIRIGKLADELTNYGEITAKQAMNGKRNGITKAVMYKNLISLTEEGRVNLTYSEEVKAEIAAKNGNLIKIDELKEGLFNRFMARLIGYAEQKRKNGGSQFYETLIIKLLEETDNARTAAFEQTELEITFCKYETAVRTIAEYADRLKQNGHRIREDNRADYRYAVNLLAVLTDALKVNMVETLDERLRQFKLSREPAYITNAHFVERYLDRYMKMFDIARDPKNQGKFAIHQNSRPAS